MLLWQSHESDLKPMVPQPRPQQLLLVLQKLPAWALALLLLQLSGEAPSAMVHLHPWYLSVACSSMRSS